MLGISPTLTMFRGSARVAWRNNTNPPWAADFAAMRVTPATDWRHRRLARWRGIPMTAAMLRQLAQLRAETMPTTKEEAVA